MKSLTSLNSVKGVTALQLLTSCRMSKSSKLSHISHIAILESFEVGGIFEMDEIIDIAQEVAYCTVPHDFKDSTELGDQ